MPSSTYQLVIHSHDPHALARFWSAGLDQPILFEADDEVIVGAHKHAHPGLCFVTVPITSQIWRPFPENKQVNHVQRRHIDPRRVANAT